MLIRFLGTATIFEVGYRDEKKVCRLADLEGEIWDSNPRPSEPQSDALTS